MFCICFLCNHACIHSRMHVCTPCYTCIAIINLLHSMSGARPPSGPCVLRTHLVKSWTLTYTCKYNTCTFYVYAFIPVDVCCCLCVCVCVCVCVCDYHVLVHAREHYVRMPIFQSVFAHIHIFLCQQRQILTSVRKHALESL